jgi:hypothetical protein
MWFLGRVLAPTPALREGSADTGRLLLSTKHDMQIRWGLFIAYEVGVPGGAPGAASSFPSLRYFEQDSQIKLPHARQWCLRFVNVKPAEHSRHCFEDEFGSHCGDRKAGSDARIFEGCGKKSF